MNGSILTCWRAAAVAIVAMLAPGMALAQASNPMWQSGYNWMCEVTARTICERDGTCKVDGAAGAKFEIEYENTARFSPKGPSRSSVTIGRRSMTAPCKRR